MHHHLSKSVSPLRTAEISQFFDFFEMARACPPAWIFVMYTFYWLMGSSKLKSIALLNFIKIGNCRCISIFEDGGCLPSWMLKIVKYYWLTVSRWGGARCITVPDFVKSVNPLLIC